MASGGRLAVGRARSLAAEFGVVSKDFGPSTLTSTGGSFVIHSNFCRSGRCPSSLFTGMTLSFDAPISALGFYIGDGTSGSAVQVGGDGIGNISPASSGFAFVGIYDPVGTFTSIALPGNLVVFDIDDVSYAAAAVVPLPASLPLLAGAMLLLGLLRRRPRPAA
jgi:hypothetical protein